MQSAYPDIPQGLVAHDLTDAAVQLQLDSGLYPLQAIYGAAYIFIDRCYVLLDRPKGGSFSVTLTAKVADTAPEALRAMVGEFANELLSQAWRQKILEENRVIIETVTTQALAGAMGPPSLDDLAAFDFSEESFEDPLGIAMSWEDKYKKKPDDKDAKPEGGSTP